MTYDNEIKALLSRRNGGNWDAPLSNTNPYMCFVFNYVTPYRDGVMPIITPELYLMSVINTESGAALSNGMVESLAKNLKVGHRAWNEINGNTSLTNRLLNMRALAPGLMLTDVDDFRVFIPNPIYRAVRHAKEAGQRCRPAHVATILQACRDKADVVAVSAAYESVAPMLELLWSVRDGLWADLLLLWNTANRTKTLKDFAEVVQHHPLNYLLFMYKNKEITNIKDAISGIKPVKLIRFAKNKWEKEFDGAARLLKYIGGTTNAVKEKSGEEEEGAIPFCQAGD